MLHTYGIVDTGNKLHEGVAINRDLARKLQLPIAPCNVTVGTAANGTSMNVIGRIYGIDIILGGTCPAYIKSAMVIPELRSPINLGSKWIEQVRGMVDYSTPNDAALVVRRMRVLLVHSIAPGVVNTPEDKERSGIRPGEHSPPNPQISVLLQPFEDLNKEISSYISSVNVCKPTVRDLCKNEPNFLNGNVHHSRDFKVPRLNSVDSHLAQLSFKLKAKAEFERKNVWTRCIKGAPPNSQGPRYVLKQLR